MNFETRFAGIGSLLSPESLNILKNSHCAVIGLGGVGSWVVESFARSGIGSITLVDLDDICVSNTNRQIHAELDNYGKLKIDALEERVLRINPDCKVRKIHGYFNKSSIDKVFGDTRYDFVVDAIDSVQDKCELINHCFKTKTPMVISGSVGGKSDPTKVRVAELSKTRNDLMLRKVRKKLKREYGFPLGWTRAKVKAVYTEEPVRKFRASEDSESSHMKLDCSGGLGAITHVSGTIGFFAAHIAISYLISRDK